MYPKSPSVKKHEICSDPTGAEPICAFPMAPVPHDDVRRPAVAVKLLGAVYCVYPHIYRDILYYAIYMYIYIYIMLRYLIMYGIVISVFRGGDEDVVRLDVVVEHLRVLCV